ncbi:MAG: rhomboid family intramembrane serine protease [Thermoanaerobaculia bacterium]
MLKRQTSGSVVCPACGRLVGVQQDKCGYCGRSNPGMWGFASVFRKLGNDLGFVELVIGGCAVLYLLTLAADPHGVTMGGALSFLSPSSRSLFLFGASGAIPVFSFDRWWTVLSASWLHGGLLHIFFNMMWVRQLAPATANLFGPGRMVLIYSMAGVSGFLLTSVVAAYFSLLRGASFSVGASAAIFGLLGALVLYGRETGSSAVGREAWKYALILGVFGFIMPGIDNFAHIGGFIGGYGAAKFLNPLIPERVDHLIAAVAVLILTVVSILASVGFGRPFLQ